MSAFPQAPLSQPGWIDTVEGMAWLNKFWASTQTAITSTSSASSGAISLPLLLANGITQTIDNTYALGQYFALVDIEYLVNCSTPVGPGGFAALWVQTTANNAATAQPLIVQGIVCALNTAQASTNAMNDAIAGYFSVYNQGVTVQAIGLHSDMIHASGSTNSMTWGLSTTMERTGSGAVAGWTAGIVVRSALPTQGSYDYGVVCAPFATTGTYYFESLFAGGYITPSGQTVQVTCEFGLDLRYATCTAAGIYLLASTSGGTGGGTPIVWGTANGSQTSRIYFNPASQQFQYDYNATKLLGISSNGIMNFPQASTGVGSAPVNAASASLFITWQGTSYKIPLSTN